MRLSKSFWSVTASCLLGLFIAGSTAQVATPSIDLSVGPIAINSQAVNVALALSVEFPTVGAAYRSATYDHTQTYLGYWDAGSCYSYFDETDTSAQLGQYFVRSGAVDSNGYCNTTGAGTGYGGNLLNFAATSSIDLLRYALTGGNRVVDSGSNTVLGRAYLASDFRSLHQGTGGYWPEKSVSSALVGKVTPVFITPGGTSNYNGSVFFNSCDDKIYVGNTNTGGSCDAPGNANIFGPPTPNLSGSYTTVGFVTTPMDTSTTTYVATTTKFWARSSPVVTLTYAPSGTDPDAGTLVPEAVSPSPRNLSSITGTSTTPQYTGDASVGVYYTATSGTSTTAPPAAAESPAVVRGYVGTNGTSTTAPPTAAESPAVIRGYVATGGTTTTAPPTGAESPVVIQGYTAPWTDSGSKAFSPQGGTAPVTTSTATLNYYVCYDNAAPYIIRTGPQSSNPTCGSGQTKYRYTSNTTSNRYYYTYYNGTPYYNAYGSPYYKVYTPYYKVYTSAPYYNVYTVIPAWYQASVYTVYNVYSNVSQTIMKAAVQVCTGSEATSRTDLCTRYPNGNYKPIGEVQKKATGLRLAAFGYANDDTTSRYGGVLRAPMKYPGPTYTDSSGAQQTNPLSEWDANSGVFVADPLGASPTYTYSGVTNYLNRFGTTGTPGNYKGYDPVGELYYEALRYFQGLSPTAAASSGLTTAMYDGYPIYSNVVTSTSTTPGWTDPVQNACQRRNFILTIGDVNTWYDKQLPGHNASTGVNEVVVDPARAAEPLLGSSNTFDAVYWTSLLSGFESGTSVSYTDSQGRTQNTAGNPNTRSGMTTMQRTATGAGSSAYYWAGAAYWANTQSIRLDTKGGQSMKDVRVKTFTIDVDEGGNGSIEDANPRGIKPRSSSFYMAGKYGWFNDANLDGNPFKTSGGTTDNSEWQDPDVPNTPDGYVIASQAQKMIDGIRKFFSAVSNQRGALTVSSLSSSRYTSNAPNGDQFSARFNVSDWSGAVQRSGLKYNTTTQTVDSIPGVIWDSGAILTTASTSTSSTLADPYIAPANRVIYTLSRTSTGMRGDEFSVANKANLDTAVLTSLNTNPATGATDNASDSRINWIRGNRSDEKSASGGTLRARSQIMGDVINSGPVYKQAADPDTTGIGYSTFASSVLSRTATLYTGANDGMLHAFRASDGKESFAYIPRAVATKLNLLTASTYTHRPYVDGVPAVNEAKVGSSWKTVLASGMGGGANGVFAIDVTNPSAFGSSSVMFEFTDQDDVDMGSVLTPPRIVKIRMAGSGTPVYKWFIAVSSGYNNYVSDGAYSLTGRQALFLLSLDKAATDTWTLNTNYYKLVLPTPADATKPQGLANPGIGLGPNGEANFLYAGDLEGNMWRFNLSGGLSTSNLSSAVQAVSGTYVPMFIAQDSNGLRQPITIPPVVTAGLDKGLMVVFGTGKFIEPSDASTATVQSMYGVWDPQSTAAADYQIGRSKLYQRTIVDSTTTSTITGSTTFTLGLGTTSPLTYRGWYFDLSVTRERVTVTGNQGLGFVTFNTTIPDGSCNGDGSNRPICVDSLYGNGLCTPTVNNNGFGGTPNIVQINAVEPYSTRTNTGRRQVTLQQSTISVGTKFTDAGNAVTSTSNISLPNTVPAGRMSWREIRNFRDN